MGGSILSKGQVIFGASWLSPARACTYRFRQSRTAFLPLVGCSSRRHKDFLRSVALSSLVQTLPAAARPWLGAEAHLRQRVQQRANGGSVSSSDTRIVSHQSEAPTYSASWDLIDHRCRAVPSRAFHSRLCLPSIEPLRAGAAAKLTVYALPAKPNLLIRVDRKPLP